MTVYKIFIMNIFRATHLPLADNMQRLIALCADAKNFPRNIKDRNSTSYNADQYGYLDVHAANLFSIESDSSLDSLELSRKGKGTKPNSTLFTGQKSLHLSKISGQKASRTKPTYETIWG